MKKCHLLFSLFSRLSVVMLIFFATAPAHAWFRGGEITWSCTPQGNFSFMMKLYRDCAGPGTFGDTLWIKTNAPGLDSIGMVRMAINDITPLCDCPSGAALSCATATQTGSGALEEHIYTSHVYYPLGVPLTGVPPVTGYYFAFEGCCRAPATNLATGNSNFAIRSVMYPYVNVPINTCFDNSPVFRERSPIVTCSGIDNWNMPHAYDQERDSVLWEWAKPLHDINTQVAAYNTGYSYLSPLPSLIHDSANSQAVINPAYGDIAFRSHTTGTFVVVTKATVFKAGVKVAEIFREIHVIVIPCPANNTPKFSLNGLPSPNSVVDSIYAGTILGFSITATDTDTCQGGGPSAFQQTSLSACGMQFAHPVLQWGCTNPPCATLNPVIHQDSSISGSPSVQTTLTWHTDYNHLTDFTGCCPTCPLRTYYYDFYFTITDNFCPVPAKQTLRYRVVVIPKPQIISPPIVCADVQPNGDVALSWNEPEDSMSLFSGYYLQASSQPGGSFIYVDSLFSKNQTSATHYGAYAQIHPMYYLLRVKNDSLAGKPIPGLPFDTLSTLFVHITGYDTATGVTHLAWNPLRTNPLSGILPVYTIHREYPVGTWTVAGITASITWSDTLPPGNKMVRYKVSTTDTVITSAGPVVCQSNSNIAELLVNVGISRSDPSGFTLGQNIPNPAGKSTVIPFYLPEAGEVTLTVHDINGRVMINHALTGSPGENQIRLDLSKFASGIYSYSLHYLSAIRRKSMVVE